MSTTALRDVDSSTTRLDRLDSFAERSSDLINPILIKETRQALKSRQFVLTFSVILIASVAWTIAGSLSMMPNIYTRPSAPRMLIGYYLLLALPMLLVVPLAAYRSLEAEIDDGTLELLSITSLSPWQIVLGKLASASLQMALYLVVLFPCVAYAYTLRGVDLPMLALMLAILITSAIFLTVIALSFAPLARGRTGRISTLLVVLMVLLLGEYLIGAAIITMILYGNPLPTSWTVFLLVTAVALAASLCHLLLTTTAAQLTPESENRSSPIRWSLLIVTILTFAIVFFAIEWRRDERFEGLMVFFPSMLFMAGLWTFAGALMAAESPALTPRIQRELPGSFLSRMLLLFFTPGPATGLVFATIGSVIVASGFLLALYRLEVLGSSLRAREVDMMRTLIFAFTSYLVTFLVFVRGVVAVVRIRNHPRVEIGLAALIAVAVLMALVPYSLQLHANDYISYPYSGWQITNWAWTLEQVVSNQAPMWLDTVMIVVLVASVFVAISTVGVRALPIKTSTPQAVLAERNKSARSMH